jgi:hypothetical protein
LAVNVAADGAEMERGAAVAKAAVEAMRLAIALKLKFIGERHGRPFQTHVGRERGRQHRPEWTAVNRQCRPVGWGAVEGERTAVHRCRQSPANVS